MLTEQSPSAPSGSTRVNVADRLSTHAAVSPDAVAVASVRGGQPTTISFSELEREATLLAHGLVARGVRPGHRIALLVKPGIEFVALVFALLRSGATMVLVDGGLGRKNIVRCLESTSPDGFVAIPQGHALRVLMRKKFPNAKLNVTVGRRWFWGGETLDSLRVRGEAEASYLSPSGGEVRRGGTRSRYGSDPERDRSTPPTNAGGSPTNDSQATSNNRHAGLPLTAADDPAAIVFTSGSTGPPKGVVYRHETFTTQCEEIQREYNLKPGAVDLACFPLFGLFNVACGVTTVLPEMDFSRPASCDPAKLFEAANAWKATQSFASPAVWDRLSRHAEQTGASIPTLQKVFSCGAPVPAKVIRRTLAMVHPEAELHTPYGATESLPVATIEAQEILNETAAKTDQGAGVCVGKKFASIDWRIIKITDDPIATIDDTEELPTGEIGELIVRGPQVSREYLANDQTRMTNGEEPAAGSSFVILHSSFAHNQLAKITDNEAIWHRIGDVGYFDEQERFWYCGRKSQRVVTSDGTLFTERVEAIYARSVFPRAALVKIASKSGTVPAIVLEAPKAGDTEQQHYLWAKHIGRVVSSAEIIRQEAEGSSYIPIPSERVLTIDQLPTDIRHNSKIRREELAEWAARELRKRSQS